MQKMQKNKIKCRKVKKIYKNASKCKLNSENAKK